MNKRIVIDAGHGGSDSGATYAGLIEKNINLIASLEAKRVLVEHGYTVLLTRDNDTYLSLSQRADIANRFNADAFISIHANAGGGDGAEAIHSIVAGEGKKLAEAIAGSIETVMGQNIRRVFSRKSEKTGKDYYGVIRQTKMIAVITEGAFLDNEIDNKIIDTLEEQKRYGEAVAKGIIAYYEGEHKPVDKPVRKPVEDNPIKKGREYVGTRCKELQSKLIALGYDLGAGGADGIFGAKTLNALINFQSSNGLVADGLAGDKTFNKLNELLNTPSVAELQRELNRQGFGNLKVDNIAGQKTLNACPTIRKGARGNITRWVQGRLKLKVDGIFGSNTEKAVKKFQDSNGLTADGIVGKNTWRKLLRL